MKLLKILDINSPTVLQWHNLKGKGIISFILSLRILLGVRTIDVRDRTIFYALPKENHVSMEKMNSANN